MTRTEQTYVQRLKSIVVCRTGIAMMCAAVVTLLLGALPGPLTSTVAHAQYNSGYYQDYGYSSRRGYRKRRKYRAQRAKRPPRKIRKKRRRSRNKKSYARRSTSKKYNGRKIEGPVTAVISLNRQHMMVYDAKGLITSTRVSTGKNGHRTPTGVFSVIQKRARHYSNLYGGAPMPFMQRITWSGIALHAGVVPNYPASHGCIRLPYSFARKFWKITKMGARVIITRDSATPRSISHAHLLKPLPPGDPDERPVTQEEISGDPADLSKNEMKQTINSNVDELIGVATANAATAVDQLRTRQSVARERKIEVLRRKQMITGAQEAFQIAADDLKEANVRIKTTLVDISTNKKERGRHFAAEKKAKYNVVRTVKRLKIFFRKYRRAETEEAIARGIERENALEADLMQFETEAEEARRAAAVSEKSISDLKTRLNEQKIKRNELKIKYATMSKSLRAAKNKLKVAEQTLKLQDRPVHIMISRKAKKLYVRQGYKDILEADISIAFPDAPIGTHVFTTMKYINEETDLSWSAITAARSNVKKRRSKRKKREQADVIMKGPAQTPANALDRVDISQELREKLAEFLKPGSSLIISDERKSHETGLGTDIIVLTRK